MTFFACQYFSEVEVNPQYSFFNWSKMHIFKKFYADQFWRPLQLGTRGPLPLDVQIQPMYPADAVVKAVIK